IAAGYALGRTPVRPGRMRQARRVALQRERRLIDIALGEMLAPKGIEMGHERRHSWNGGMDVAVNGARRNFHDVAQSEPQVRTKNSATPKRRIIGAGRPFNYH